MSTLQQLKAKADRLAQKFEDDFYVVVGDDGLEVVSGATLDTSYWFLHDNDILYCTSDN